ncbi:BadF/BadG/BcrA/BcrD ATPase family protein [Isoptericola jiangsuensis]|uniref:BadF/BadG/BcrA/BcrD ATPase family protein n=1 Tax=Isoptericola jiangsuensis TaxID=548579 RepID=UPI003AB095C0
MTVLAIDVGGSGSRVALSRDDAVPREEILGGRAEVGPDGSTVPELVLALLAAARQRWPDETAVLDGVAVGATGLGSLVADPAELARAVRSTTHAPTAVAIDAVTAHLGALGGAGGAVVVLGTGAIAVGYGGPSGDLGWARVDGWGHLLGDRGSGALVGMEALRAALRAHDGVDAAGAVLLDAARRRLGDPETWPGQLYTRPDRAGVLATFAVDVVDLAAQGEPTAHRVVADAGADAARSAVAALGPGTPAVVALTGGLARAADGVLRSAFSTTVAALRPDVRVQEPAGDPLDGALALARSASVDGVEEQKGFVWT